LKLKLKSAKRLMQFQVSGQNATAGARDRPQSVEINWQRLLGSAKCCVLRHFAGTVTVWPIPTEPWRVLAGGAGGRAVFPLPVIVQLRLVVAHLSEYTREAKR
jgi:hypothetical protein